MTADVDIRQLLKAINEKEPTGNDLREAAAADSIYYTIKDARNQARLIERKNQTGEDNIDPKPYWDIVLETGQEILVQYSKDLEIAVWLTEALIREQGFAGLNSGLQLIEGLVIAFWEKLYPMPDEEGIETRIAPIAGLNGIDREGTLIQPIYNQAIVKSKNGNSYALWQYKQALEIEKITDKADKTRRLARGGVELRIIKEARDEAGTAFYNNLKTDIDNTKITLKKLKTTLSHKCGKMAPPTSQINQALTEFLDNINFILEGSSVVMMDVPQEKEKTKATVVSKKHKKTHYPHRFNDTAVATISVKGVIESRQHALDLLKYIAVFFRQTEPHSPLAYGIERLVRWGNTSLPELMKELISDSHAMKGFATLTGLPTDLKSDSRTTRVKKERPTLDVETPAEVVPEIEMPTEAEMPVEIEPEIELTPGETQQRKGKGTLNIPSKAELHKLSAKPNH